MDCKHVQSLFSEHYDEASNEVEAHLKGCVACATKFTEYCEFMAILRNLPDVDQPPADYNDRLLTYVHMHKQACKPNGGFKGFAIGGGFVFAAAAAAVFMFVWFAGLLDPVIEDLHIPIEFANIDEEEIFAVPWVAFEEEIFEPRGGRIFLDEDFEEDDLGFEPFAQAGGIMPLAEPIFFTDFFEEGAEEEFGSRNAIVIAVCVSIILIGCMGAAVVIYKYKKN